MNTYTFGFYRIECLRGSRMDMLCKNLKKEFPKLKMTLKRDVWWHWVRYVGILIFTFGTNRKYFTNYTTTSKNRIDLSDQHHAKIQSGKAHELDRVWTTLRHERVHLRQFAKYGTILMALVYLHPPFVFFAYGRGLTEKPGYLESLRGMYELNPAFARGEIKMRDGDAYIDWLVGQFTNSSYGWAMYFHKKRVRGWFDNELAILEGGEDVS